MTIASSGRLKSKYNICLAFCPSKLSSRVGSMRTIRFSFRRHNNIIIIILLSGLVLFLRPPNSCPPFLYGTENTSTRKIKIANTNLVVAITRGRVFRGFGFVVVARRRCHRRSRPPTLSTASDPRPPRL